MTMHQWFQDFHGHHAVGGCGVIQGQSCCVWLTQCHHYICSNSLSSAQCVWADWQVAKLVSVGEPRAVGKLDGIGTWDVPKGGTLSAYLHVILHPWE